MASTSMRRIINLGKLIEWIKNNKAESLILFLILLVGAFFRLYRISEYMTFLGDEGRDAIIVRRLLVNFDPILIGPGTSIGNMYLGPIYYYMIAPFLLLFGFNPVGPSVFVALLGVATIFFVWFVVRKWFFTIKDDKEGQQKVKSKVAIGALISATLYAISPVVITYSHSSWNPNIMPFFSLLVIFSIWEFYVEEKYSWILVSAISLAVALQSHYLSLLLIPVVFVFWCLSLLGVFKLSGRNFKSKKLRIFKISFFKYTAFAIIFFILLMSPLLIFDVRHGWNNFLAIKTFFTQRQTTVSARPWVAIPKIPQIFSEFITRVVAATDLTVGKLTSFVIVLGVFWILKNLLIFFKRIKRLDVVNKSFLLLFVWMAFALVGLGLYKQHIYDHYYGFFFTAPFILLGGLIEKIKVRKLSIWNLIFWFFVFYLLVVNLKNNPLRYPPNRQMQRAIEVASLIKEKSEGRKFNLAVIAERNYEDGYQYFLEKWGQPVYDIDPLNYEETLGENLFVVCELSKESCDPTHNPKAEIANFGWSKIEGEWEVSGVTVYKLVHVKKPGV